MRDAREIKRRRATLSIEMKGDPAHRFISCAPARRSPDESFLAPKIFHLGREFLQRFRRHAPVKLIRLVPFLIEERLRTQDRVMRQRAPAEYDSVRAGKAVFADVDRLRRLPARGEINAMGEELRAKSADGGEGADAHSRGAIDQMAAADSGVGLDDQLRPPVRLMREMPARAARKTGDPIQLADDGVRAEMQEIDVLAEREMPDAGMLFHDEPARENPGEADVAGGMNGIAELFLEKRPPQRPRQQERKKHQELFHHAGARAR